jgi:uncharacterized protein involved in exopolysaccharide biosynthesis
MGLFWPPVYAVDGTVLVKRNRPMSSPESLQDITPELTRVGEQDLMTEVQILRSHEVVALAVSELPFKSIWGGENISEDQKRSLEGKIRDGLSVTPSPRSNVIKAELKWGDPVQAEKILKTILENYLDYRTSLYNPAEAESFFHNQLEQYSAQLKQMEERLVELARNTDTGDPQQSIKANLLMEENIRRQIDDLESKYLQKKKYISAMERMLEKSGMTYFTAMGNLELGDMGKRLQQLMMDRAEALKVYQPESPYVKRMDEQINVVYKSVETEARRFIQAEKAVLSGIRESLDTLKTRVKQFSNRNVELYRHMIESKRINREIAVLEDSYETFARRWQEARINSSTNADKLFTVSILSQPRSENIPVFPVMKKVLIIGAVLGLLLGTTLAFLWEFFDHSFKRPEDVQNYTDLQPLFSIPKW